MREHPARRPRVLVLNQYYWPGVEATAQLLSQLCESLADEFDITVVTGRLYGVDDGIGRSVRKGVEIVRVRSSALDRARLAARALNYLTYIAGSLRVGWRQPRPDVILCMTDPPIVGDLAYALARRFRVPFVVISQDVFPEIAVQLGRLQSRIVIEVLRAMINFYLRHADRVVAIGETMRERLAEKGAARERISIIPNWADTAAIEPQARDNPWSREHGLSDRFVVMHSGNIGHAQDLETLVRAATFLRDLDDLTVTIIGAGARKEALQELAEQLAVEAVRFLPYQPRELLSQSLSAADVHVVGLARGLAGYVVPSRVYGIMAAARPVIVCADADSETAKLVRDADCGIVVPPGRPDLLAAVLRRARSGEFDLEAMGLRARQYVLEVATRSVAVERYRELLRSLTSRGVV